MRPSTAPVRPPPAPPSPPKGRRGRAGFIALVAGIVLAFGGIGGGATYFLFLKSDDTERSSANQAGPGEGGPAPETGVNTSESDGGGSAQAEAPATESGLLPRASRAEMERDIGALLGDFHAAVVDGRFEDAWDLLSDRKQRQVEREDGVAAWREAQSSLTSYLDPSGLTATIDDLDAEEGSARVRITGMAWSKPGATCSEWSGLTWVKYEGGQWRYDPGYSTTPERERAWKGRFEQLLGATC